MSITFTPARRVNERTTEWLPGPEVNVSNRNAALLLTELDIPFDHCGDIDAKDLLARILLRRTFPSGISLETIEERGAGGARMIDCGVDADYIPMRLAELEAVAEAALRTGGLVQWC